MSRIVTKAQAATILGISKAEVVRRIERGELKAKKKSPSKFSDWLIELPNGSAIAAEGLEKQVKEAITEPEPDERREEAEEIQAEIDESAKVEPEPEPDYDPEPEPEPEVKPEPPLRIEHQTVRKPKEEVKKDGTKPEKWWF